MTQWEDVRKKVIVAMAEGAKGIGNIDGATEKAGEALHNNLTSKLTQIWRDISVSMGTNMKPIMSELGNILDKLIQKMPDITRAIDNVFISAEKVYNSFKNNWVWIEPTIVSLTIAFTAYHGTILALSAPLMIANTWTKILTVSQWAWNVALNANPIGLVVAGIGVLAYAGYQLYKNWDTLKYSFEGLWNLMQRGFANIKLVGLEMFDALMTASAPFTKLLPKEMQDSITKVRGSINKMIEDTKSDLDSLNGKQVTIELIQRVTTYGELHTGDQAGTQRMEQSIARRYVNEMKSNSQGIDRVQQDGDLHKLDKGERVLPAYQADKMDKGEMGNGNTYNFYYQAPGGTRDKFQIYVETLKSALKNI